MRKHWRVEHGVVATRAEGGNEHIGHANDLVPKRLREGKGMSEGALDAIDLHLPAPIHRARGRPVHEHVAPARSLRDEGKADLSRHVLPFRGVGAAQGAAWAHVAMNGIGKRDGKLRVLLEAHPKAEEGGRRGEGEESRTAT